MYSNDFKISVIEYFKNGNTQEETAKKFKVSAKTLEKWLKTYAENDMVKMNEPVNNIQKIDINKLKQMIAQNPTMTLDDVVQTFNCTKYIARVVSKKYDINLKRKFHYNKIDIDKLRQIVDENPNMTLVEIAKIFDCSKDAIVASIKKHSIKRKPLINKKIDVDKLNQILTENPNMTLKQIASVFNCSKHAVSIAIRKHNITRINTLQTILLDGQKLKQIIAENKDVNLSDIAKLFGCSKQSVLYSLKIHGIPKIFNLKSKVDSEILKQLIDENPKMSLTALSKHFGCSRYIIRSMIKNHNITRTPLTNKKIDVDELEQFMVENPSMALKDIAKTFNCSKDTILINIKKYGMARKINPRHCKINREKLKQIVTDNPSIRLQEIAKIFSCSNYAVYSYMKRNGITKKRKYRYNKIDSEKLKQVIAENPNMTLKQIANIFDCKTAISVSIAIKRNGIIRKSNSQRKIDVDKLKQIIAQNPKIYLTEIAEEFNCSKFAVSASMKKYGITKKRNVYHGKIDIDKLKQVITENPSMTLKQIANIFNCSDFAISHAIKRNDIYRKSHHTKIDIDRLKQVITENPSLTLKQIANIFNCSDFAISHAIKRNNICRKSNNKIDIDRLKQIITENPNMTLKQIANIFNCSNFAVSHAIKRNGIIRKNLSQTK
jgi:transcriptional antiterminator